MKKHFSSKQTKPFLKWAGGKGQLIEQIDTHLPRSFKEGKMKNYFEPFLGGGALFFWLSEHYDFNSSYLFEINPTLCLCYQVVQNNVKKLIKKLELLENEYFSINEDEREIFYYERRKEFNELIKSKSLKNSVCIAALLIFLNKTCFNGLYRENSKGEFNVPFGRYKNPTICNKENLYAASILLQNSEIVCGDFAQCIDLADDKSFVYFDPPYRPISTTASFNSYSKDIFNDREQQRLREVYGHLNENKTYVMLSNSDPKNINPQDNYFDELYNGFNIKRLNATRLINCNAERRGVITEILVMNY
jgi:DNA adenine methylase